MIAEAVGIEHTQQDAHDQRAERQAFDEFETGDVEGREREERDQQDSVQDIASFFGEYHRSVFTFYSRLSVGCAKIVRKAPIRSSYFVIRYNDRLSRSRKRANSAPSPSPAPCGSAMWKSRDIFRPLISTARNRPS